MAYDTEKLKKMRNASVSCVFWFTVVALACELVHRYVPVEALVEPGFPVFEDPQYYRMMGLLFLFIAAGAVVIAAVFQLALWVDSRKS